MAVMHDHSPQSVNTSRFRFLALAKISDIIYILVGENSTWYYGASFDQKKETVCNLLQTGLSSLYLTQKFFLQVSAVAEKLA